MQLTQFRVQNYKSIEDTDWVKCNEFTAFVGKNEAGKSAIFLGLSKLNPSDNTEYNGLKEFPRSRFSADFEKEDWPVSSGEFIFESGDLDELNKIHSNFSEIKSVIVTRHYSNDYTFEFKPDKFLSLLSVKEYHDFLKKMKENLENKTAGEGKGERLGQIKTAILTELNSVIESLDKQEPSSSMDEKLIDRINTVITSNLNEDWEQKLFNDISTENKKFQTKAELITAIDKAEDWILKKIPQFIYFDHYDVIESAIDISDFIRKLKSKPNDHKLRITKCLFDHVNLDLTKLQALDPNDEQKTTEELKRLAADERFIRLSSASTEMSQKFESWWEVRKYEFSYDIDGVMFRVWVRDNLNPSKIELDQRSAGMQYFFSFYLVFLTEVKGAHKNSILLLDEPGIHYHGTAQKKAVEFLKKLSQDNQLMYTTHSPFMIDGDRLEDVKVVYSDKKTGNTLVSDNVWPKDDESLFPLQAGLGYSIAQTLFYSKYQLIVEGLTDYSILKAINELLSRKKMKTLDDKIIIVPAGGIRNIMPLASMLMGNKVRIAVLLDGDQPGLSKEKQLKEDLLVNCIVTSTFSKKEKTDIEDFFDESMYLKAVKECYADKELDFNDDERKIPAISKRVDAIFKRKEYDSFEKWKPAHVLVDWIQRDSGENKISDETCRKFESLFVKTNEILI